MARDSNLTGRMQDILEFLLRAAKTIIEGRGQLTFEKQEYLLKDIHLSPTVYEMLKRFEFSYQKQESDDDQEVLGGKEVDDQTQQDLDAHNALTLYEQGVPVDAAPKRNRNANLGFDKAQMQAYANIPVPKDTIFDEFERDWQKQER